MKKTALTLFVLAIAVIAYRTCSQRKPQNVSVEQGPELKIEQTTPDNSHPKIPKIVDESIRQEKPQREPPVHTPPKTSNRPTQLTDTQQPKTDSQRSAKELALLLKNDRPVSAESLLARSSAFRFPELGDGLFSGSVLFEARGFLLLLDVEGASRMAIERTTCPDAPDDHANYCMTMKLNRRNAWESFDSAAGTLKARIVDNDPYVLVFKAGEKYMVQARWLKHDESLALEDYSVRKTRAVFGHFFRKEDGHYRLIGRFLLLEPPSESEWPDPDLIRQLIGQSK